MGKNLKSHIHPVRRGRTEKGNATYLGMDVSARSELRGYGDAGKISNYAKEAMSWAVATGLIRGITGTVLSPGGSATRAQAATLAIRFRGL